MRRVLLSVLALSVFCSMSTVVWADVKAGSTNQTRDIMLVEEAETADGAAGVNEQRTPSEVGTIEVHKNDFKTTLETSSPNGVYKPGDPIVMTFTSEKDAYLTILNFAPSGNIVVLYPNDLMKDKDHFVKAGESVVIPVAGDGFVMKAGENVGVDVVKAIATTDKNRQIYDKEGGNVVLVGPFTALKDTVSATRDILLEMEEAPVSPDQPSLWSVASCAVMTDNGAGTPNGFAVTADGAAKMWTNGYRFLVGERVFVHLLSGKKGELVSLVNVGASSEENNMLPAGEKITFEPGQLLVLPRAEDKWKFVAAQAPGDDEIKAKVKFDDGSEADLSFKVTVEEDDGE